MSHEFAGGNLTIERVETARGAPKVRFTFVCTSIGGVYRHDMGASELRRRCASDRLPFTPDAFVELLQDIAPDDIIVSHYRSVQVWWTLSVASSRFEARVEITMPYQWVPTGAACPEKSPFASRDPPSVGAEAAAERKAAAEPELEPEQEPAGVSELRREVAELRAKVADLTGVWAAAARLCGQASALLSS